MAVLRPAGDFDTSYEQDMSVVRQRWQWGLLLLFVAALFALPYYAPEPAVSLANRIGIAIIAVQGLNILTGYTGQISLGQAAFMTVGAYISALLVGEAGWSFFLALPVAGLMSDRAIGDVRAGYDALIAAAAALGSPLHDPFMAMSFMALEVIPKLKLTDRGLVDVDAFDFVDLFVDA